MYIVTARRITSGETLKYPYSSEVEVIKEGDQLTLRPRGKDWAAWFDGDPVAALRPANSQPSQRLHPGVRTECGLRIPVQIDSIRSRTR